jgi:hypothetical protein
VSAPTAGSDAAPEPIAGPESVSVSAPTAGSDAAPEPTYTAAEVDAALAALQAPERLRHAEEVVTHAAPALQRALAEALHEGGWFGEAHDAEVARAAAEPDGPQRARVLATLVAEQTRLGMFVGAALGFELARELHRARESTPSESTPGEPTLPQARRGETQLEERPADGHTISEPTPNPKK